MTVEIKGTTKNTDTKFISPNDGVVHYEMPCSESDAVFMFGGIAWPNSDMLMPKSSESKKRARKKILKSIAIVPIAMIVMVPQSKA